MTTSTRWLAAVLLVGLSSPAWSWADRPDIKDDGEFFSKTAKEQVQPILADIHKLKKEFVIETFAKPAEKVPEGDAARVRFFEDWARERARAEKVNGVYLLICREPAHFEIMVGTTTKKKLFREGDRGDLASRLRGKFKQKEFDEGLIDAATFVRDRMRTNLRNESPALYHRDEYADKAPAHGGDYGWLRWVWIGLAVVVGIWIVRAIFAGMSGGMGGGGGFFSGFLGGMFGAAAGMWLYDSFFHSGGSWGGGGDTSGVGGGVDADNTPDTDYSGGGDDFGGGDFGGGDGGGDFGGGDF